VHLTNVAVQKTSPDYHPKKVAPGGQCVPITDSQQPGRL
ncbi:TTLL9 isoform 11, partial [Pan troglodytes]